LDEIKVGLGEESISTDEEDLRMHGYSEWSSLNIETLPVAVAYPKSTEEVSRIAKICHKYRVPMSKFMLKNEFVKALIVEVPFSGGTSLEANFAAPFGGVSVDFSEMNKILALHADEYALNVQGIAFLTLHSMDVVVQPSVPWMSLNERIRHTGLFFPVDPGPSVSQSDICKNIPSDLAQGKNRRHGWDKLQVGLNSERLRFILNPPVALTQCDTGP
jgi:D-lactate dehydrogenase (cytochrome)